MVEKTEKTLTKRKKFIDVEVPLIRSKIEVIGNSPKDAENRTVKIDLTRQLKGKGIEAVFKISLENNKPVANPIKIRLMPYFIRRMIRKRISYVEDSFLTPSQENILLIKPFLITRKRVSRAVRKTLRNKCKNWLEDYIAEKRNNEIFNEIFSSRLQKSLSIYLKKTYPLSLCEIRVLEINRELKPEEVPKIKEKPKEEKREIEEDFIDQMEEIEREKIKKAEKEIKETQDKVANIDTSANIDASESADSELTTKPKKERKPRKKKEE